MYWLVSWRIPIQIVLGAIDRSWLIHSEDGLRCECASHRSIDRV